jgi:hypothetical protein
LFVSSRQDSFGILLPSATRAPIHHALVQLLRAHHPGENSALHALFKERVI